jgi:alpha-tubulin suppressor-like RCC1 family protein
MSSQSPCAICFCKYTPFQRLTFSNVFRQAGHGTDEKYILAPRRIEALASERMACIAVGPNHCLAANVHGELFAFGRLHTVAEDSTERYFDMAVEMPGMRDQDQGTRHRAMVDRSFEAYYAMDDAKAKHNNNTSESYSNANLNFGNFKSYLQRTPILVDGIQNERVVSVAAGYGYSVAITDMGRCYTWGFNDKLQLGLGHRFNQHKPQLLRALEDKFCVAASCGQQHTLVLCQDGTVFSWGLGVFGQLGHGSLHDEKVPKQILDFKHPDEPEKDIRISSVACGSHHSLALDTEGRVWSWGSSEYAQQFQSEAKYYDDWGSSERRGANKSGQSYYYSVPRLIMNAFETKKVVTISCGNLHNVALTESGECWTWGWGVHVRLNGDFFWFFFFGFQF